MRCEANEPDSAGLLVTSASYGLILFEGAMGEGLMLIGMTYSPLETITVRFDQKCYLTDQTFNFSLLIYLTVTRVQRIMTEEVSI